MSDLLSGIANLTKQVTSNISTYEIRKIREKVEGMVLNYTEEEALVREATNEDPWGPTGQQMKDITHLSFQYDGYSKIMPMLWKRLFEDNRHAWRRVYKSLTLLNYLLHHGSERVISSSREHLYQLRALESYKFIDEKGRDQGINVRHRCGKIVELLDDEEKLRQERKKAKDENKEKYQGYNSNDARLRQGYSSNSYSSDSYSSNRHENGSSSNSHGNDDYSNKEVNSFSFPEDPRQSCEVNDNEDDDGFESFAQSRSGNSPNPSKNITINSSVFGNTGRDLNMHMNSSMSLQSIDQTTSKTVDLLGLDAVVPTSATLPSLSSSASPKTIDLFSDSCLQQSSSSFTSVPRPPSNGPAANSSATVPDQVPAIDLFGDFSGVPSLDNTKTPTLVNPNDWLSDQSICKKDDDFADFTSFQAPASTPVDLFDNFNSTIPKQSKSDLCDFDSFSSASQAQITQSASAGQIQGFEANAGNLKVGNTWNGANSDLFNLDNLGTKNSGTSKHSLSLNQMQQNKKW